MTLELADYPRHTCADCGKDITGGLLQCHLCGRKFCGPCRDKDRAKHEAPSA